MPSGVVEADVIFKELKTNSISEFFLDKLYRSYGKNAEIIKMAIAYGNLKLIDSYNLLNLKL